MASYTSNYKLYKPNRNDGIPVDESLAGNFEKIDAEIRDREDAIEHNSTGITDVKTVVSGHARDIGNIQKTLSESVNDISNLQESTSNNKNDIGGLKASVSEAEEGISTNASDINTLNQNVGGLSNLGTKEKSSLVNAINEVNITVGKGKFTASGDDKATTVDIPHNLGDTPDFYQVQEGSGDAGAADISHVTADKTNITVAFKSSLNSGTDNIVLVWRAEL